MNKYYQMLNKILKQGKVQTNKKGNIRYLLNEQLSLSPAADNEDKLREAQLKELCAVSR